MPLAITLPPFLTKRTIRIALIITVFSLALASAYWFMPTNEQFYSVAWFIVVIAALWLGNMGLTIILDRYIGWIKYGNTRFFLHLLLGILYTLLVINATYVFIKVFLTVDPPTIEQIIVMNVYGAMIFVPVYSIYFSLHFLRHWRTSELASEKYQKESMRSQLESLKNYLDPHFLFNNLNVLSSLIDADQALSKKFLDHFAEVYRAMLRTRAEDLIPLRDELEFIHAYVFLLQVRFGDTMKFHLDIPEKLMEAQLPPLTLQILVENAIKHNRISESRPLMISVTVDQQQNYLSVINSIYLKPQVDTTRTGSGHEAIRERYRFFTEAPVMIEQTEKEYQVRIPLLTPEAL